MAVERGLGIPQELTFKLEEYSVDFLSRGRKEWDEPHTRAVVFYAGEIAKSEGLDVLVMITTAWIHDIGYYGLFEDSDSDNYANMKSKKSLHMANGAKLAREFLERPEIKQYYTQGQVERVVHLVSVHDNLEALKDPDELAFMEADTLGALDISRVTTTFSREEGIKYLIEGDPLVRRFPRFRTATGIRFFQDLLPKFVEQFR